MTINDLKSKPKKTDKGGFGERWLLRICKKIVKFLESAGVQD